MCLKLFYPKLVLCLASLGFSFLIADRDDQDSLDSPYIIMVFDMTIDVYLFTLSLHLVDGKFVIKFLKIDSDCVYNISINIPDNFETTYSCGFCQSTTRDEFRRFVEDPKNNNPPQL